MLGGAGIFQRPEVCLARFIPFSWWWRIHILHFVSIDSAGGGCREL